ncbi:TPA: helix-turn-helix domain-containing protein [Candidatus Micrarchaeota archaeon]|nr:helix-turn-helix domain-containing protein [Candidatus Micrarchaeota archaeon]
MGARSGIKLSRVERRKLSCFLKKTKDSKSYRAALGVLLRAQGKGADEVGIELGVTKKQVFKWCRQFRENGIEALQLKKPPGRPAVRGTAAKKRIPQLLQQEPSAFGYMKGRWVVRDIAKQLEKEGVLLCFQSVHFMLQDLGLRRRRPKLRAPGSIRKNYFKRRQIANYKRIAGALLKKE